MKPIYQVWDFDKTQIIKEIVILFLMLASFGYTIIQPGTKTLTWDPIYFVIPIFVLLLILSEGRHYIRLAAFTDRILIHKWWFPIEPFVIGEIDRENIVSIQASPQPATLYFPSVRQGLLPVDTSGWRTFVLSGKNKGLMIETKQRKYMVSCPNAEEAARILSETYNLPDIPITPPPTWHD
jgi:hypothetical protein